MQIGVANGTLSLGGALSVTAITGALFIETEAGQHPSVAGTLSATVAFNVPGVTVSGTLGVQVNSGAGAQRHLHRQRHPDHRRPARRSLSAGVGHRGER